MIWRDGPLFFGRRGVVSWQDGGRDVSRAFPWEERSAAIISKENPQRRCQKRHKRPQTKRRKRKHARTRIQGVFFEKTRKRAWSLFSSGSSESGSHGPGARQPQFGQGIQSCSNSAPHFKQAHGSGMFAPRPAPLQRFLLKPGIQIFAGHPVVFQLGAALQAGPWFRHVRTTPRALAKIPFETGNTNLCRASSHVPTRRRTSSRPRVPAFSNHPVELTTTPTTRSPIHGEPPTRVHAKILVSKTDPRLDPSHLRFINPVAARGREGAAERNGGGASRARAARGPGSNRCAPRRTKGREPRRP